MIIVNIFIAITIFILFGICYLAYYVTFENGHRFEEPPGSESEEMVGVLYVNHDSTDTPRNNKEEAMPKLFWL